jgi:hypothetical protein
MKVSETVVVLVVLTVKFVSTVLWWLKRLFWWT